MAGASVVVCWGVPLGISGIVALTYFERLDTFLESLEHSSSKDVNPADFYCVVDIPVGWWSENFDV